MARRVLIAGNWKMNTSRNEALALATSMLKRHSSAEVDCVIFPPVIWLEAVARVLAGSSVQVGAQDCSSEARGAFTGQIAPDMVRELGNWVIVGHSERRRDAGESDQLVGRKAAAALQADLTPIMCVGESLEVRESGNAEAFVGDQVDAILAENTSTPGDRLVFAYEPIWAIGTGRSASAEDAQTMAAFIRRRVGARGQGVRVLYGGSVTADNAPAYLVNPDVDGLLVGGASLKADQFLAILAAC